MSETGNEATINWPKVEKAIQDVHKMLFNGEFTLLEIDLIVFTFWTNSQKDKVVQLAFQDVNSVLKERLDKQLEPAKKDEKVPGGLYG